VFIIPNYLNYSRCPISAIHEKNRKYQKNRITGEIICTGIGMIVINIIRFYNSMRKSVLVLVAAAPGQQCPRVWSPLHSSEAVCRQYRRSTTPSSTHVQVASPSSIYPRCLRKTNASTSGRRSSSLPQDIQITDCYLAATFHHLSASLAKERPHPKQLQSSRHCLHYRSAG
jgi:hypothetical protein